jgi:hypothetical protein
LLGSAPRARIDLDARGQLEGAAGPDLARPLEPARPEPDDR